MEKFKFDFIINTKESKLWKAKWNNLKKDLFLNVRIIGCK
jgi:hypothetical protein